MSIKCGVIDGLRSSERAAVTKLSFVEDVELNVVFPDEL
jgi:hypothetical protein